MRRLAHIAPGQKLLPAVSIARRALSVPRPATIAAAQPRVRDSLVLRVVARHKAAGRSQLHEPRAR
jgi:hypothetical protein